jgi:lysophospholipase L1-like esterase
MIKKIALALVSTVVFLLAAEIILRLLGIAPGVTRLRVDMPHGSFQSSRNPVLGYEPRPGSPGINDYGIRDRDYDFDKPPGGLRIVTIGDSVGYGFCNDWEVLDLDSLFMKQLERNLQQKSRGPVEAINLCVSGYDAVQEVEFLAVKGLALDPDIVVMAYCLNDDFDASKELQFFRREPHYGIDGVIAQKLVLKSHLARMIWLHDWKREPRTQQREPISRTEQGFARLAALGREHGFQPVIVVFPLFEPIATYRWHGAHQRAAALAAKYGIPVLDLLEPFREASQDELSRLQGRCNREHPDESGHRVAARAIERFLQETGLVSLP